VYHGGAEFRGHLKLLAARAVLNRRWPQVVPWGGLCLRRNAGATEREFLLESRQPETKA
jgi:hypothetical protein